MISINGFKGLGYADSYGNSAPAEGTSLPSTELLLSSDWGAASAPAPASPPRNIRAVSRARPPASPSLVASGALYGPAFPPPTKDGESILGVTLPSWLPKWAVYGAGLAALAFAGDFAYRRFVKGGRRVAKNPKGRRRTARVLEGDDEDDEYEDGDLVERAAEFREKFHWGIKGRKRPIRRKVSKSPKVATKLGELTAVIYKTKKRGEKAQFFHHEFGEEGGKKPTLGMDIENKKLHIIGGDYDVQADGIID